MLAVGLGVTVAAQGLRVAGLAGGTETGQLAQRVESGDWDTFSARVAVRRAWVADDGGIPLMPATLDEYVYERTKTARGWRTRIQVVSGTRPTVRTPQGDVLLDDDMGVGRIEEEEDGSGPRFFTRAGVEIVPPTPERWTSVVGPPAGLDPELVARATAVRGMRGPTGRDWVRAFVLVPGEARARREAMARQFGRRSGTVRGLDRYVRAEGEQTQEWLIDDRDGVPVEANVTERGVLRSHVVFAYARTASGALVRQRLRVERALGGVGRERMAGRAITEVTYSHVQLSSKGGR
ncbi:MAG: hypothetical protein AB7N65_26495 [Vicinamibacterales bacterium]